MESVNTKCTSRSQPALEVQNVASVLISRASLLKKYEKDLQTAKLKIISNPEENIKELKIIIGYLSDFKTQIPSITKLCLSTIVCIFDAIIPNYTVKTTVQEGQKTKMMSKEMLKIKLFEDQLLSNYTAILNTLSTIVKYYIKEISLPSRPPEIILVFKTMLMEVIYSVCLLLQRHQNFNKYDQLVLMSVKVFFVGKNFNYVKERLFDTFKILLENDMTADTTRIIISAISALFKKKANSLSYERVIDLLKYAKIDYEVLNAVASKRKRNEEKVEESKKFSRKLKKAKKQMKKVEKDLEHVQLHEKRTMLKKNYTQILTQIFSIYFRVVKNPTMVKKKVFNACLLGMCKYAIYVGDDYYNEITHYLHYVAKSCDEYGYEMCISAISALVTIKEERDTQLSLDEQTLYKASYQLMNYFMEKYNEEHLLLLAGIVDTIMFSRKLATNKNTVKSFVRKLCLLGMHTDSLPTSIILEILTKFFQRFYYSRDLLTGDETELESLDIQLEGEDYQSFQLGLAYDLFLLIQRKNVMGLDKFMDAINIKKL